MTVAPGRGPRCDACGEVKDSLRCRVKCAEHERLRRHVEHIERLDAMNVPVRFANLVIPPVDDDDTIDHPKYSTIIDVRLNSVLHNAGVETIGDLRRLVHDAGGTKFARVRNLGQIGRVRIGLLLGIGAVTSPLDALASSLREGTTDKRVQWFRDLGNSLKATGFNHPIVDELMQYTE